MKSPPQSAVFGDRASDEACKSGGKQGLWTASIIETAEPNRSQIDDIHRKNWVALCRFASTLPCSFSLPHTDHKARIP